MLSLCTLTHSHTLTHLFSKANFESTSAMTRSHSNSLKRFAAACEACNVALCNRTALTQTNDVSFLAHLFISQEDLEKAFSYRFSGRPLQGRETDGAAFASSLAPLGGEPIALAHIRSTPSSSPPASSHRFPPAALFSAFPGSALCGGEGFVGGRPIHRHVKPLSAQRQQFVYRHRRSASICQAARLTFSTAAPATPLFIQIYFIYLSDALPPLPPEEYSFTLLLLSLVNTAIISPFVVLTDHFWIAHFSQADYFGV